MGMCFEDVQEKNNIISHLENKNNENTLSSPKINENMLLSPKINENSIASTTFNFSPAKICFISGIFFLREPPRPTNMRFSANPQTIPALPGEFRVHCLFI
jgi:hypothetical protein